MTAQDATHDGSVALDSENPWPGLDFFGEHAHDYFHGREAEATELLRHVTAAPLTVLFGKSGLGKTSLLKAGLFPRLRRQHFLPIYVRLSFRQDAPRLIDQVGHAIRSTCAAEHIDAPAWPQDQTLWEFLHRRDAEFWSQQNFPLVAIIVFDQFEELFTLGQDASSAVQRFKIELADLAENRIPEALAVRLTTDAQLAATIDVRAAPCRFIVSLREDFLADLEGWRRAMPSLGRARLRLLPMRPDQAMAAVYDSAPHLMDRDIAERIVEFVAAAQTAQAGLVEPDSGPPTTARGEIEPALLSLFCRGLNDRRKAAHQARFDVTFIDQAKQSIISDYYRSCVESLPPSVSRFIENELITEKGFRNSYSREDAVPQFLSLEQLDYLIKQRLLRIEERYGAERIELTHDLLTRAVMEHRTLRRQQDAERERARREEDERNRLASETVRQRARFRGAAAIAAAGLVLAAFAGSQWYLASQARARADEALKESQSRDFASQSMLVGTTDPTRALELALSSIDQKATPQSAVALRLAFARARLRGEVTPPGDALFVNADVSPTGDRIAVVRSDGVVEIYAIPSLRLLHHRPNDAPAAAPKLKAFLGLNPEDVIVITKGKQISRWKPATNSEATILPLAHEEGWSMRLAGSVDNVLVGDGDRNIILNLSTGRVTEAVLCRSESAPQAAASIDGRFVTAFFSGDRLCKGQAAKSIKAPGAEPADLAQFSPDTKRLVTARYEDEVVRVWDLETAAEIATIRGLTAAPSSLSFVGPRHIAFGTFDGAAELWRFPLNNEDAKRPDQIAQLTGSAEPVSAIFAIDGARSILSLHSGGPLRLWEREPSVPKSQVTFENPIDQSIVNSQGMLVAMDVAGRVGGAANGAATLISSSSAQPDEPPRVRVRSHDRTHVLVASADGLVRVWNLNEQKLAAEFRLGHPLMTAAWATPGCGARADAPPVSAPNGVTCAIATVDADRVLRVHVLDGARMTERTSWTLPIRTGVRGLLSPDWKHWIEDQRGDIAIVNLGNAAVLTAQFANLFADPWPFVQGGRSLLIQESEVVAFLKSLDGTSDIGALKGHAQSVVSAVVSPDGSRVVTASEDWTARVWDAPSGLLLSVLRGHVRGVTGAIFNRDGSLVATISRDGSIRVWEPVSGTSIFQFELGSKQYGKLSDFDGGSIVLEDSRSVWLIDCEACRPVPDLVRLGRERLNLRLATQPSSTK